MIDLHGDAYVNEGRKMSIKILIIMQVELIILDEVDECWLHLMIHNIGES